MAALSLGRTVSRRLGGALLLPALLWAPLAGLVGYIHPGMGLLFEGVLWGMSVPFALLFAGWMPVAERMTVEGGMLCLRWWSMGEQNRAFPLSSLVQVRLYGSSLRLQLRGEPSVSMRLPWGTEPRVERWLGELNEQLGSEEGQRRAMLDLAVVAHTHEGVKLRFGSVYQPLPLALVALSGVLALVLLGGVFLLELLEGSLAASFLLLGLAAAALATRASLRQIRAVELALVGAQLKITTCRTLGTEQQSVPLADLRGVERFGGELYLVTQDGRIPLPLPDRSRMTVEAIEKFLAENVDRAAHLQGQVAPELDALLQQGARREALRQREQ